MTRTIETASIRAQDAEPRRPRRWIRIAGTITVGLVIGAAAGWAANVVLTPAPDVLDASTHTYATVKHGEVGASIVLNTTASWALTPVGINRAAGVVTSIATSPGEQVSQGKTLYSVNLRPVVVAKGSTPSFRAIEQGSQGPDVAQVQDMLADLGLYGGPVDGRAGAGTVAAIKAWQKMLGQRQSGAVDAGDIIFVPTLPAEVTLDSKTVFPGATLSGGEQVLSALSPAPDFIVPVTADQAALMPDGTRVEVTSPKGDNWVGLAAGQTVDPASGTVNVHLKSPGSTAICGSECAQISITGKAILRSDVVTVPPVTGLVVPSAALMTTADGKTVVVDSHDKRIPVTVKASARGMSIVDGVAAGVRVQVPATGSR